MSTLCERHVFNNNMLITIFINENLQWNKKYKIYNVHESHEIKRYVKNEVIMCTMEFMVTMTR